MGKRNSVTIVDIANRAGVSFKTVSRVLNHNPRVAEALRLRVEAAIQDFNYKPNRAARSLSGSRTFMVALLLGSEMTSPFEGPNYSLQYVGEVQRGMLRACGKNDYTLVVDWIELRSKTLAADLRRHLGNLRVDGALLAPPMADYGLVLNALESMDIPYVRVAPGLDPERSFAVGIDDHAAASEMTRYLQRLGHRRIGFVCGPAGHIAARARLTGYREATLASANAEPIVATGAFTFQSGMDAGADLLRMEPRPTAIFAANDEMAAGVMAAVAAAGLRVPHDISVAGFDDSSIARLVWPALTTVRQPVADMSACATQHLIDAATQGAPLEPIRMQLPFEIQMRASTAAPC